MYIHVYVCVCIYLYICMHAFMHICMCLSMHEISLDGSSNMFPGRRTAQPRDLIWEIGQAAVQSDPRTQDLNKEAFHFSLTYQDRSNSNEVSGPQAPSVLSFSCPYSVALLGTDKYGFPLHLHPSQQKREYQGSSGKQSWPLQGHTQEGSSLTEPS